MAKVLQICGWDVLQCCGGVSMVAKPTAYLGKTLKLNQLAKDGGANNIADAYEFELNNSNFREAILTATGLCINSGSWTGIPSYCRLTLALEDSEFEKALECIVRFKKAVLAD